MTAGGVVLRSALGTVVPRPHVSWRSKGHSNLPVVRDEPRCQLQCRKSGETRPSNVSAHARGIHCLAELAASRAFNSVSNALNVVLGRVVMLGVEPPRIVPMPHQFASSKWLESDPMLRYQMRVVDYLNHGNCATAIVDWSQQLGFQVERTIRPDSQRGVECGYMAAAACEQLTPAANEDADDNYIGQLLPERGNYHQQ